MGEGEEEEEEEEENDDEAEPISEFRFVPSDKSACKQKGLVILGVLQEQQLPRLALFSKGYTLCT